MYVKGECEACVEKLLVPKKLFKTTFDGEIELSFMKDDYAKWIAIEMAEANK